MGIFGFLTERLELKELLWQQYLGCHFVPFVMHICGAKFQEHCFNISRDIFYSVFYHFLVANLMTSSLIQFA